MKETIILTGFMGSGKTTIGKALAEEYGFDFIDTDKQIEISQAKSIKEIFVSKGEAYFRRLETDILRKMISELEKPCIIAAGGGMLLCKENQLFMKQMGKIVYLEASLQTISKRLENSESRPLLNIPNRRQKMHDLLKERTPTYTEAADFIIDINDKTTEQIVAEIKSLMVYSLTSESRTT